MYLSTHQPLFLYGPPHHKHLLLAPQTVGLGAVILTKQKFK